MFYSLHVLSVARGGDNMTIKEVRQAAGLSRKAFASEFQLSIRTVESWEQGVRTCPNHLLRLIIYYLHKEGMLDENTPSK